MSRSGVYTPLQRATGMCLSYCPHGGACTLPPGHEGLHLSKDDSDDEGCRWDDHESISQEEADKLLVAKGQGAFVELQKTLEAVALHLLEVSDDG